MYDEMNEIPGATPDFRTELAEKLAGLVPEAVADGKIDTKKLEELLDGDAADTRERFGLFWPGKKRALRAAQEPTTATLVPDRENSKDWDTTRNVFIEGDNLEVLKILQKHYHGKIKMIYIDPPYNTGKDFVYPDNYQEGLKSYLEFTKQVDEGGKKLSTNSDQAGRYHSNWLNMMYPRLKLARNLLTDDGVIFISIDDNEQVHLRKLCDEIFGERNFVASIMWQKKQSPQNDATYISDMHDYVLVYARRAKQFKGDANGLELNKLPRTAEQEARFKNPDDDTRGAWISVDMTSNKNASERPNLYYTIKNPETGREITPSRDTVWRYERSTMDRLLKEGRVWFGRDDSGFPRLKKFKTEMDGGVTPSTWWTRDFAGDNQSARRGLRRLFPEFDAFSTPKPTLLLKRMVELATDPAANHIVLDFFSGSASTGHAVMEKNAEDGGNRRHIQVQIPEPTTGSEAERAGYQTLSAISRERLRRSADALEGVAKDSIDTGFRAYKLSDTNFAKWSLTSDVAETELEKHLFDLRQSADAKAPQEALLTELLLKRGYSLTEQVDVFDVAGLEIHGVKDADGDYGLLAYLNEHQKPSLEQLRSLVDKAEAQIVILEDAFQGDDQLKTNLAQLCKSKGIELWTA